jgi:translation initiation factor IF-1
MKAAANEVGGTIEEALPSALYRVKLDDGSIVVAGLSTEARRAVVKVAPGDRVTIAKSPFDPSRGKITGKRTTPSRMGGPS